MNSRFDNLFRIFFAFTDLGFLCVLHLVLLLNFNFLTNSANISHVVFFIMNNIFWLISSYLTEVYINDKILNFKKFARRTSRAFILYLLFLLIYLYFSRFSFNAQYLVISFGSFLAYLIVSRILFLQISRYIAKKKLALNKVIILGNNAFAKDLAVKLKKANHSLTILGCFSEKARTENDDNFTYLGTLEDSMQYAVANQVTEIYCTLSPEVYPDIYDIAQYAENLCMRFRFVPDLHYFVDREVHVDYVNNIPVLSLRSEPLEDFGVKVKKRVFDIVFSSLVALFLLSWLVPLIALLIKLDSKGPVFFLQERSGLNNKPFKCIKFRSLKINDEANSKQVTRGDKRITKLGKFLRKSSIDELPQFFNVLKGDMSVVGPRPHMLKHTEEYSSIIMKYMIRHYQKPGVTGYAQVNGFRGEIKTEDQLIKRIEYDVWYIENWSIWLDLKIIIKTIIVTLKGDENAF
ncbi:undecaprenyl-phosphate glucose phosphotransferase [Pelobium manganitolerans]|uniref:Undecaprenyl-phosphate glucose phosphotransferase n=1 Tax=Pelobium manganitolerans TaxID=1842495 RepID=A0A419S4M7_9SPHI|nr:undecaprenyl-phosphate glucose phosphotransferase [Pelobium manganitolerans]RKD15079.1 undecaprenyl-phosphate glucose phosphotransferase [Pelobium manganitolerans]